ncbi:recombinase RecT [Microbispora amethystogenes]|uniref:recombinase RecT n=1 Tax=Microbispora amethystogenes TaxID=1427754 RepID=UPI0033DF5C91
MSNNRMSAELEKRVAALSEQISADSFSKILAEALPEKYPVRMLMRDALAVVDKTPDLAMCHGASVLGGLVTCAQLGLRLGVAGLNHAYLIPMWNSRERRKDATLIVGYKGYVELAMRHPEVGVVFADCVYEGDTFRMSRTAMGEDLVHDFGDVRGAPQKYYAVVRFTNGQHFATRPWTQDDMNAHRDKYAMARTKEGKIVGPWALGKKGEITDQAVEMGKKTMIRGPLVKSMPLLPQLAAAVSIDEGGVRTELDPNADPAAVTEHPNRPEDTPAEERDPTERETITVRSRPQPQTGQPGAPGMLTADQDRHIIRLVRERNMSREDALALVEKTIGEKKSARQLTEDEAKKVIAELEAIKLPTIEGNVMQGGRPTQPEPEPYDRGRRERRMFALLKEKGVVRDGEKQHAAKAARIAYYQHVLNSKVVESTRDLTNEHIEKVIAALEAEPTPAPAQGAPAAPAPEPAEAKTVGDELEQKVRAEWPGTKTALMRTFYTEMKTNLGDASEAELDAFLRRIRSGEFAQS